MLSSRTGRGIWSPTMEGPIEPELDDRGLVRDAFPTRNPTDSEWCFARHPRILAVPSLLYWRFGYTCFGLAGACPWVL
jgi:hypothetical protein